MKRKLVFTTIIVVAYLILGIKFCDAVEGDVGPGVFSESSVPSFPSKEPHEPFVRDTIEVIIGSRVIGNVIPFWGNGHDACRFQVLFLQSEINVVGEIINFAFMPSSSVVSIYNDVTMYCCHTSISQLGSVYDANYGGNTPLQVMDKTDLEVGGPANDWMPWDILFSYNNIDNLLVEIRWHGDNNVSIPLWRTGEAVPRRLYAWDEQASSGTLQYTGNYVRLLIVSTGIEEETSKQVSCLKLEQSIPNPFRLKTSIEYTVNQFGKTTLTIYDTSGRKVKMLVNEMMEVGCHEAVWDGKDENGSHVESGVYFCRLQSSGITAVKTMIYLR